jgi:hypothetical protein
MVSQKGSAVSVAVVCLPARDYSGCQQQTEISADNADLY